jgi:heterodisulfide reductase subunit D
MVQDVARSFSRILTKAGVDFTLLGGEEWCCGYALVSAGHPEDAAAFMRHNVDAVRQTGARTVAVTCPGCYRMWKNEKDIEVLHSTEFILRLLKEGRIAFKELKETVSYHDPCDLGRVGGIFDEPRSIIQRVPGITFSELEYNREHANCCGSGGDLLASNQELSLRIAHRRVREASDLGVQTLVTACPSCVRSMTMAKNAEKIPLTILDITQLAWKAVGG